MKPNLTYKQANALLDVVFNAMELQGIRGEVVLTSPAADVYGVRLTIGEAHISIFKCPKSIVETVRLLEKINDQLK